MNDNAIHKPFIDFPQHFIRRFKTAVSRLIIKY